MYKNTVNSQLNTMIVQVRAFKDAIYPTKNFPTASWISSDQKDLSYDPLKIMIDMAHEYNLKFEAWLNPTCIATDTWTSMHYYESEDFKQFDEQKDLISFYDGGDAYILKMYLNPASDYSVNLIVDGVKEIVKKYDVDGIHFDDCFYSIDKFETVQERKDNVDNLIKKVYKAIKAIDSDVVFGISTDDDLEYIRNLGVDVDSWLSKEGYVDYVMPQIYSTDQHGADGNTKMFSNRLKQWTSLWTNKKVDLMVGLGLHNVDGKPADDIGWSKNSNNIATQIKQSDENGIMGFSLFRYADLMKSATATEMTNMKTYLAKTSGTTPTEPEKPGTETGWVNLGNGDWNYINADATKSSKWVAAGKDWFYVQTGRMLRNSWVAQDASGDVWYYVDNAGKMLSSTTVDGYVIDGNGRCFM